MAKKKSGFALKGELTYEDGRFFVVEIKKESEDTYDLTNELASYVDRTISITVGEEVEIEPVDNR